MSGSGVIIVSRQYLVKKDVNGFSVIYYMWSINTNQLALLVVASFLHKTGKIAAYNSTTTIKVMLLYLNDVFSYMLNATCGVFL
jgi:hypothetical protein